MINSLSLFIFQPLFELKSNFLKKLQFLLFLIISLNPFLIKPIEFNIFSNVYFLFIEIQSFPLFILKSFDKYNFIN